MGRERELAALREAWGKAASGTGQVVGIVGEAGVGKSRLLVELRALLPPNSHTYLEGRCLHFGGSMPYLPVLDLLRLFFEVPEGEREYAIRKGVKEKLLSLEARLERVLSPLQDLLSLKVEDEAYQKLEPKKKKERTFEALRDLFLHIGREHPLVLAVEDLHWIDTTSREFLDYFIGWIANSSTLLLLLYRPEFTHAWASRSYYNQVNLGQLPPKTSAELMASILGGGEAAPELQDLILNRAGGNPLFMEELTHSLLENGSIQEQDRRYVLSRSAAETAVPDTVQGIIAARIDRLEENLRRTMQVASVIGREFAFRLLQTITGIREELKAYLLNLQDLEFIYEKKLFPELEYIFKHVLTQEVAYNTLLLQTRKELHGKIGAAIEEIYVERLEEFYEMLAYHYAKGEQLEKAYRYSRLSADKAKRNHCLWEALRFQKESLLLLQRMPETAWGRQERLAVILLLMPISAKLGYPDDPTETLQEGEALSRELEDHQGLALMYRHAGSYHSYTGNGVLGGSYLERSFDEAEKVSDPRLLGPIAHSLFVNYGLAGKFAKIPDMAVRVIRLLEENHRGLGDLEIPAHFYSGLYGMYGQSLGYLGDFEKGEDLCEKAVSFACEAGDPFSIATAEWYHGATLTMRGRGAQAIGHLQKAIERFERSQGTLLLPLAWSFLGGAYFLANDISKALECAENWSRIPSALRLPFNLPLHNWFLSLVYLELGDSVKAPFHAQEGVRFGKENNQRHMEGLSLTTLGLAGWKSRTITIGEAEKSTRQGIEMLEELKLEPFKAYGYLLLGELFAGAGEREKALENLKVAEHMAQEMGMDYWLARARKDLGELHV